MSLDGDVAVPEGSYAEIGGISALGTIYVEITLGSGPPLPEGSTIPGQSSDLLGQLTDRAPELLGDVDTLLGGAGATFSEVQRLLSSPESDLRQTLAALRSSAGTLERLLRTERATISRVLANADTLSAGLAAFTSESGDSLTQAVQSLSGTLDQLDRSLAPARNHHGLARPAPRQDQRGRGDAGPPRQRPLPLRQAGLGGDEREPDPGGLRGEPRPLPPRAPAGGTCFEGC